MFEASTLAPISLGFFGLGMTYLVWGPQEAFGFPARDEKVDRSMGMWGIFMAGLCQLVTGLILFLGLTLFRVFQDDALYMAALAFSAYGIHWFVLGWNRYRGNSPVPNVGMSFAFTILSVLGAFVFFDVGLWAVGVLFVGLTWVYVAELFASIPVAGAERILGLAHTVTGLWLMYLTVATTLNLALGYTLPAG